MAGEPESLHVHEALQARVERHDYDRLLMLSDGVFAIAITLLNLLLLGLIGLTPFVAKMIAEAGPQRALPFYLVALASVFASLTLIRLWALLRPSLLHAEVDRGRWRDELLYQAAVALGLGGLGIWSIVNERAVGSVGMLAIVVLLAAARRLVRHRSSRQTSSVSRP